MLPSTDSARSDDEEANEPPHDSVHESKLDQIIAGFLSLHDAGRKPDPAQWVADHPQYAVELVDFFANSLAIEFVCGARVDLGPGSEFGDYEIVRVITRRDSGEVHEARRLSDGLRVALKVFSAHPIANASERARFRREIAAVAELDHPNIVPLLDSGEVGGVPFLVMPFLSGGSFSEVFASLHPARKAGDVAGCIVAGARSGDAPALLDPNNTNERSRAVAMIGVQVARALAHAHASGILHRDVKPGNIMRDDDGRVSLIDFSVAYMERSPDLTRHDEIVGALRYMAPERFRRWSDVRSDVYSLGITLIELVTLQRAFPDSDLQQTLESLIRRGPRSPRKLDASIPRDLETILLVAIQPEPANRYASAQDLADDLQRWLDGHRIVAKRPGFLQRCASWSKHHKFEAATVLLTFLLLISLVGFWVWRAGEFEYQTRLFQIQEIRHGVHASGWSLDAWSLAEQASKRRRDFRLRDEVVGTLAEMDAKVAIEYGNRGGSSAVFGPGDRRLLLGGAPAHVEGDVRAVLWDLKRERAIARSDLPGAGPVALPADDRPLQLLDQGEQGVVLWDLLARKEITRIRPPGDLQPRLMALSRDGIWIAVATSAGVFLTTADPRATLKRIEQRTSVTAIEFSCDGSLIATGDEKGIIHVFPTQGKADAIVIPSRGNTIRSLAFRRDVLLDGVHPPGWLLASGDSGGVILVFELPSGRQRTALLGSPHEVTALAFSPDQMTLASAGRECATIWDLATARVVLRPLMGEGATSLAYSHDGRTLACPTLPSQRIVKLDVAAIEPDRAIACLMGLTSESDVLVFSPNSRRVAVVGHDWRVGVWDIDERKLIALLDGPRGYYADNYGIAFSPDGEQLAVSTGREAQLWDLTTGLHVECWPDLPPGNVDNLVFPSPDRLLLFRHESDDGRTLPTDRDYVAAKRTVVVRDLLGSGLRAVLEIKGYKRVNAAAFAPDGRTVAIHGWHLDPDPKSQSLRMIDLATGGDAWPRVAFRSALPSGRLFMDPSGSRLFWDYTSDTTESPAQILNARTGAFVEEAATTLQAMNSAGDAWAEFRTIESRGRSPALHLRRPHGAEPFLRLDTRADGLATALSFSPNDRYFAWRTSYGQVMICDLPRVREQLRRIGLDW